MKIWFDTEFIEDGSTIELISIGMAREDGCSYYAESSEVDWSHANPWVMKHVVPHLGDLRKTRKQIADEIRAFVGAKPQFWAWYAAYDWVVLCWLYGNMVTLPKDWPMFPMDLRAVMEDRGITAKLPAKPKDAHNALADALWLKRAHESLITKGLL